MNVSSSHVWFTKIFIDQTPLADKYLKKYKEKHK